MHTSQYKASTFALSLSLDPHSQLRFYDHMVARPLFAPAHATDHTAHTLTAKASKQARDYASMHPCAPGAFTRARHDAAGARLNVDQGISI